jgi:hypothetical protein
MASHDFDTFLDELANTAHEQPDVVGLAGFGSTAARERVDEWSDHDFAWITTPGAEDIYRCDLGWLPDSQSIALSVVEHHGGVKVIYDNGHVLEFGITDVVALRGWAGNSIRVIVDKGGVADSVAAVLAAPVVGADSTGYRFVALLLTQVLIGVGRYRRGEVLSASGLIRGEAVNHFLAAVVARKGASAEHLDSLDPRRRIEREFPELAAELEHAVRGDPETAGRHLIDAAERELSADWPEFPHRGIAAIRTRLGWN